MNGYFPCIKVKTVEGVVAYINVEFIHYVAQDGNSTVIGMNAVGCSHNEDGHYTMVQPSVNYFKLDCKVDDIMAAITKSGICIPKSDIPEVGFSKKDDETHVVEDDTECGKSTDEDSSDGGPVLSEQERMINEIADDYKVFDRYVDLEEMLNYTEPLHVVLRDEPDCVYQIKTIDTNGSRPMIYLKGEELNPRPMSDFDEGSIDALVDRLEVYRQWDVVYQYLNVETSLTEYIRAHNATCAAEHKILPNDELSLNEFGLSAGELMKSMVNGRYKKDDVWIFVDSGELRSINDPCKIIDCHLMTDFLIEHADVAKDVLPEDVYNKAFN